MLRNLSNRFVASLVDQCAVSGGNFLIVALGAHFLPLSEQGKLIYIYTAYVGLVLFNIAAVFAVAPVVRNEVSSPKYYRRLLFDVQLIVALFSSVAVIMAFNLGGGALGWQPSGIENLAIVAFLFLQQIADFQRRSGYVFDQIEISSRVNILGIVSRVFVLFFVRPGSAFEFVTLLTVTAMPGVVFELLIQRRGETGGEYLTQRGEILRRHMHLCRWNILNAPLTWGGLHLPVFLVAALASKEQAAIFGSVRAISTFANVFLGLLETLIPSWMASRVAVGGMSALRFASLRLLKVGGVLWAFGLLIIVFIGESAVVFLLGEQYKKYALILSIGWLGNGIYFVGRILGLHYRIGKNSFAEFLGAVGGGVVLFCCLPLIQQYASWGGAWTLVAVQLGSVFSLLGYRTLANIVSKRERDV